MKCICKKCSKEFDKKKSDIKRTKNNFCSRSCSVSWNNSNSPKRKLDINITLKGYKNKGDYRTYKTRINEHSRSVFKKHYPNHKGCCNCSFEHHYEVCHIKNISDFSEDEKLLVVNDIKNLIPLCPNCHWLFDNNMISPKFENVL